MHLVARCVSRQEIEQKFEPQLVHRYLETYEQTEHSFQAGRELAVFDASGATTDKNESDLPDGIGSLISIMSKVFLDRLTPRAAGTSLD